MGHRLVHRSRFVGHPERGQPIHLFARPAQRHLAGDEHLDVRCAVEHGLHHAGHLIDEMLCVVECHEQRQRSEARDQTRQRIARRGLQAECPRDGADQQRRVRQTRQIDPGNAVFEALPVLMQPLHRDACLAHAAGPGDRDEAVGLDEAAQRSQVVGTADQRRQRQRKAALHIGHRRRLQRDDLLRAHVALPLDRTREAVAAARNGGNGARPEHLAQGRDLHVQVGFLDHQTRPHHIEQFVLADDAVAPLHQRHQQIEGPRADDDRLLVHPQRAPLAVDADARRLGRIGDCGHSLSLAQSSHCGLRERGPAGPAFRTF